MRIFISSTFKDLEEYRAYTIEYLQNLMSEKTGEVIAMEFFPASEEDSYEICLEELEQSNLVIGIYGQRFGWEPDETGRSMTEIEYDRAEELGIPILKFVTTKKLEEKQARFVSSKILVPGCNCGRFDSVDSFAKVLHKSMKTYFQDMEGYSYHSIWDDIVCLREIIDEEIANDSLRMRIYGDGSEGSAIKQIKTSVDFLLGVVPLVNDMYDACTGSSGEVHDLNKFKEILLQQWESINIGLPNHLRAIRLAASFLEVSQLQHRLLTERWTDELRREVICARDHYIDVSSNTFHVD